MALRSTVSKSAKDDDEGKEEKEEEEAVGVDAERALSFFIFDFDATELAEDEDDEEDFSVTDPLASRSGNVLRTKGAAHKSWLAKKLMAARKA